MLNLPKVQISLVTYNGEKLLKRCLDSALFQSYPNILITIIDNNSTDKTIDIIEEYRKKNQSIQVIRSRENIGFSGGHNRVIAQSQAAFICCLNQDLILEKDFIKNALVAFADKKTAAVQGKLYRLASDGQKIIDNLGLVMLKNRRIIAKAQGKIDRGQYLLPKQIFGADGAAPVYRRDALEDAKIEGQYFDEDFFMYKEDVDLAWRMRLFGWQAVYQPKAVAWHDRSAGESAATNYFSIIKERVKINSFAKYLSFKNQRLMQIKNEQGWILFKHLPWFLPKEILSWIYVLVFERYTSKAIKDLFKQASKAYRKRKIIMNRKRASVKQMTKWFV